MEENISKDINKFKTGKKLKRENRHLLAKRQRASPHRPVGIRVIN
jgi:hypothetical protein